ncbi:hypothetical protein BS297_06980 [Rhodococcus erythropolis]|uniref:PucR family transcriptional regulator n=1 Tax=Rhodococcus erythropolis TaxID=1833 RepID=A0A5N5E9L7_RHOER|nr:hypothetical protein BS297_06980 [Rhodococcus erythropolis]
MNELLDDPTVREMVSHTARMLNNRQPEITRAMADLLAHHIERLDDDPEIVAMLDASVEGNVKTIFHVLANHIPIDRLEPTTAAVEYARRLAQRGIPASSLARAYHMGQEDLMSVVFAEVQRLEQPDDLKLKVLQYMSRVIYQYIDWISLYVAHEYDVERKLWISTRGSIHSSMIHKVLAAVHVDTTAFEVETGYRLGAHHVGAVVWTSPATVVSDELVILDGFVRSLGSFYQCPSPPLFTAVDATTAWAWFPRTNRQGPMETNFVEALKHADERCHIAIGTKGVGLSGFRRSHEQALYAQRIALFAKNRTTALSFADAGVGVVSLLLADLDATREWVLETLGPLSASTEKAEQLRGTLHSYLRADGNFTAAAAELNLHRNSVKYRVNKALELRGRPIGVDRTDISVALHACRLLYKPLFVDLVPPGPKTGGV